MTTTHFPRGAEWRQWDLHVHTPASFELVPVLTEAKRRRQILMVTHNPNLAVVCDAEQVIYSSFDRQNQSRITYISGSIENPRINRHVVNVLEGTKVAFDNRGGKYL